MIRYVFILILILYTIYIIYNNILFKIIMSISTSQRSNQTSNRFLKLSSRFLLQTDLTYFYSLLINNSSPLRFSPSLYRSSKTIIEKKIRSTTSNPRIILKTFFSKCITFQSAVPRTSKRCPVRRVNFIEVS